MINILVTGSNGQLGSEIKSLIGEFSEYNFIFTDKAQLDITSEEKIKNFLFLNTIDIIINCAAYTAVDKAQNDFENADKINRKALKKLSKLSKEQNISLIHISTDYVFDGMGHKPYVEEYQTNPKSLYGKTKVLGEEEMIKISPKNSIIIRTSWLYSSYGANFVKTILRLGSEKKTLEIVYDQIGTPTYARDLAKTILHIIPTVLKTKNEKVQIYHYSNEGVASWYDFAKEIIKISSLECQIEPILTKDYPTLAPRPSFSVLDKSKIKKDFGIKIPYWKESLAECLTQIKLD